MRILLILLALAASASAEIIVYKGTARTALPDGVTSFGSLPHVYLVVDLAAKKGYYVLYYTVNGKKGSITLLPLDTHYVARFVSAARTAGTFSAAIDSSSGTDIGVNLFYLRGNTKPLALSSEPAAPTSNYPRTLAGFLRVVQSIQISSIYELNLTLAFDPVHTQIGNDNFQSGQQEVLTIASELAQKGF